jgi:uncharacterized membrane protein (UPF0127 family)
MKPFVKIIIFIAITAVFFVLFFSFTQNLLAPGTFKNLKNKVCFAENCFFVKVARTQAERGEGLMFQTQLDKNAGMLFVFDKEGVYPFWMKNTLIPLDIIWIDNSPAGENKVVFINKNSQPCGTNNCPTINPYVEAKYVLEINAGASKEFDIKVGDSTQMMLDN